MTIDYKPGYGWGNLLENGTWAGVLGKVKEAIEEKKCSDLPPPTARETKEINFISLIFIYPQIVFEPECSKMDNLKKTPKNTYFQLILISNKKHFTFQG